MRSGNPRGRGFLKDMSRRLIVKDHQALIELVKRLRWSFSWHDKRLFSPNGRLNDYSKRLHLVDTDRKLTKVLLVPLFR